MSSEASFFCCLAAHPFISFRRCLLRYLLQIMGWGGLKEMEM